MRLTFTTGGVVLVPAAGLELAAPAASVVLSLT